MVKPKTSSSYEIDVFDTLMRETKHVTTGTPADKLNASPIWSKDGKFVVYTQAEAKGTNSNIFIADVKTGKSTLLTPHEGERLYEANDISPRPVPDARPILITSNAGNGYQNVGLLWFSSKGTSVTSEFHPGKIEWLTTYCSTVVYVPQLLANLDALNNSPQPMKMLFWRCCFWRDGTSRKRFSSCHAPSKDVTKFSFVTSCRSRLFRTGASSVPAGKA